MTLTEQTRNESYFTLDHLGEHQARVLTVIIEHGPISCGRICKVLGWTPNRVTGRIAELRDMGRVVEAGTEVSEFNKRVCRYRHVPCRMDEDGQAILGL